MGQCTPDRNTTHVIDAFPLISFIRPTRGEILPHRLFRSQIHIVIETTDKVSLMVQHFAMLILGLPTLY
jgi:hypothetical protein